MATRFDPVELETIDQGKFLEDLRAGFERVCRALVADIRKHTKGSPELLKKYTTKAGLRVAIDLAFANEVCNIKTDISEILPKEPPRKTTALLGEDGEAEGGLSLFCQAGGTREGNPRQMNLPIPSGT
jgi:hypothetical protein